MPDPKSVKKAGLKMGKSYGGRKATKKTMTYKKNPGGKKKVTMTKRSRGY